MQSEAITVARTSLFAFARDAGILTAASVVVDVEVLIEA
jgi:hypothetical protein